MTLRRINKYEEFLTSFKFMNLNEFKSLNVNFTVVLLSSFYRKLQIFIFIVSNFFHSFSRLEMMVYDNIVYVPRRIATLPAVVQESKPFLK